MTPTCPSVTPVIWSATLVMWSATHESTQANKPPPTSSCHRPNGSCVLSCHWKASGKWSSHLSLPHCPVLILHHRSVQMDSDPQWGHMSTGLFHTRPPQTEGGGAGLRFIFYDYWACQHKTILSVVYKTDKALNPSKDLSQEPVPVWIGSGEKSRGPTFHQMLYSKCKSNVIWRVFVFLREQKTVIT